MHWNLMNEKEIGSSKLLKLKYRGGYEIIETFCRIGSPQKLRPCSLVRRNFRSLRKALLNQAECIEI